MITRSDKDYLICKAIKKGEDVINPDFISLANFIFSEFSVKVLNIILDYIDINSANSPRLNIIFENTNDYNKFYSSKFIIDKKFEKKVIKFLYDKYPITRVKNHNNLFLILSDFEKIATDEAHDNISELDLQNISKYVDNDNIWQINKFGSHITIFLFEIKSSNYRNKLLNDFISQYYPILKKYDEFNYCKIDSLNISFDTKSNFMKKYNGSWFLYYR